MAPINHFGRDTIVITSTFTLLSVITVLLRLYTRLRIVRKIGVEDYLVILGMLFCCAWIVSIGIRASHGLGQHYQTISPEDTEAYLKTLMIGLNFYNLSTGLTKMSILVQYLRVFKTFKFRIACWCVLAVLIIFSTWSVFGNIFTCIPVEFYWNKKIRGKCMNLYAMWFTNSGMNIAMDVAIIVLPLPVLSKLQLPRRQKQALAVVFAFGGIAGLITILRLYSLFSLIHSADFTYNDAPASIWTSTELNIGIICACLPVLRPLIAKFLPAFGSANTKYAASMPLENQTVGSKRKGPIQSVYAVEIGDEDDIKKGTRFSREYPDDQIKVTMVVNVQSDRTSYKFRRDHIEDNEDTPRAAGSSTEVLVKDVGRAV